jgi:hypothetical protein
MTEGPRNTRRRRCLQAPPRVLDLGVEPCRRRTFTLIAHAAGLRIGAFMARFWRPGSHSGQVRVLISTLQVLAYACRQNAATVIYTRCEDARS